MNFGERLKLARREKGYTQRQLAEALTVSHNSVSNWEKGHNKPDLDIVGRISALLECSAAFLLEGDTGERSLEARIMETLGLLGQAERAEVLEFALYKLWRRGGGTR